jgi:hypothetical protein
MRQKSEKPNLTAVTYQDAHLQKFYNSLRDLNHFVGCSYLGYFVEDRRNGRRMGFASNPDWQSEYIGARLIEDCHLWRTVTDQFIETGREFLMFPWECAVPMTSKEKDVHLYRAENDIGANGISFCSQRDGIREFFALAPDAKCPKFLGHVTNNFSLIETHIRVFREATFLNPHSVDFK